MAIDPYIPLQGQQMPLLPGAMDNATRMYELQDLMTRSKTDQLKLQETMRDIKNRERASAVLSDQGSFVQDRFGNRVLTGQAKNNLYAIDPKLGMEMEKFSTSQGQTALTMQQDQIKLNMEKLQIQLQGTGSVLGQYKALTASGVPDAQARAQVEQLKNQMADQYASMGLMTPAEAQQVKSTPFNPQQAEAALNAGMKRHEQLQTEQRQQELTETARHHGVEEALAAQGAYRTNVSVNTPEVAAITGRLRDEMMKSAQPAHDLQFQMQKLMTAVDNGNPLAAKAAIASLQTAFGQENRATNYLFGYYGTWGNTWNRLMNRIQHWTSGTLSKQEAQDVRSFVGDMNRMLQQDLQSQQQYYNQVQQALMPGSNPILTTPPPIASAGMGSADRPGATLPKQEASEAGALANRLMGIGGQQPGVQPWQQTPPTGAGALPMQPPAQPPGLPAGGYYQLPRTAPLPPGVAPPGAPPPLRPNLRPPSAGPAARRPIPLEPPPAAQAPMRPEPTGGPQPPDVAPQPRATAADQYSLSEAATRRVSGQRYEETMQAADAERQAMQQSRARQEAIGAAPAKTAPKPASKAKPQKKWTRETIDGEPVIDTFPPSERAAVQERYLRQGTKTTPQQASGKQKADQTEKQIRNLEKRVGKMYEDAANIQKRLESEGVPADQVKTLQKRWGDLIDTAQPYWEQEQKLIEQLRKVDPARARAIEKEIKGR